MDKNYILVVINWRDKDHTVYWNIVCGRVVHKRVMFRGLPWWSSG